MTVSKKVDTATLEYAGKKYQYDVVEGTEKERGIVAGKLRGETGLITLDPGYMNCGSCESAITFIDGEKGILRYRGYDIADLADNCTFIEVSYLLVHGKLPTREELGRFSKQLSKESLLHEGIAHFFHRYPQRAHPMAILSAMVVSLSSFYPEIDADKGDDPYLAEARLLSKIRCLAAFSYKESIGEPYVYPKSRYTFCQNFLNMCFSSPVAEYEIDEVQVRAMNKLLILHADHEQNCSTSVVRMVGSSGANLFASVAAGICALWGPLHGGANQAVLEMLEKIQREGLSIKDVVAKAKDKSSGFRLMGFGHRVYKTYDPRARIAKDCCKEVLAKLGTKDPLLDLAMELEDAALNDSYFKERNLYPNIDFYTGLTYRAMGFPAKMFTVLFAIGRLPGWMAQWTEQQKDPDQKIGRPRQVYTGPARRDFVAIDDRS